MLMITFFDCFLICVFLFHDRFIDGYDDSISRIQHHGSRATATVY